MSIETQLRSALRDEASTVASPETDPYARVSAAIGRNRRHRRTVGIAAVAAVAAIAIGVPTVGSQFGDQTLPAGQHQSLPPANDKAWNSIATWPTRGSLAGDTSAVAKVDAQFSGHTIFLEDMGTRRVALVANDTGTLIFAMGPRGATEGLDSATETPITDYADEVLSVSAGAQLTILTTASHMAAEVSGTPEIALDGTVTRSWETLPLSSGTGRTHGSPLTRLRLATYSGAAQFHVPEDVAGNGCGSYCLGEGNSEEERIISGGIARVHELDPAQVRTETVFTGPVGAGFVDPGLSADTNAVQNLRVMHSHLPGGQILRTAEVRTGDETMTLEQGQPIDARQAAVFPLITSGPTPGNDFSTTVHVFVPSGTAVRAVGDDAWPSSKVIPLKNRVASFEMPVSLGAFDENYRIEVLDGDRVLNAVRTTVRIPDAFE